MINDEEALEKEFNTNYIYYDNKGKQIKEKEKNCCAYEFDTPNGKRKLMTLQFNSYFFDPHQENDFSYKRQPWSFKETNKDAYQNYIKYLNPKTRSKYRLVRAERFLR